MLGIKYGRLTRGRALSGTKEGNIATEMLALLSRFERQNYARFEQHETRRAELASCIKEVEVLDSCVTRLNDRPPPVRFTRLSTERPGKIPPLCTLVLALGKEGE